MLSKMNKNGGPNIMQNVVEIGLKGINNEKSTLKIMQNVMQK